MTQKKLLLLALMLTLAYSSVLDLFMNSSIIPKRCLPFDKFVNALGYPVQTHSITTEDGYILTFFRIQAKNQNKFRSDLPVIYLQHGVIDSGDTWVINTEEHAPGLQLANSGYDVWVGNSRGTKYSMSHKNLTKKDAEFWQFSMQNMSEYDLPAAFEYIHKETNQNITYIGHSQGTTIMFMALAERNPTVMKYLKKYIALSPVAWVGEIKSGVIELAAHTSLIELYLKFKIHQFLPDSFLMSTFSHLICQVLTLGCEDFLGNFFGADKDYDNYKYYGQILWHEPGGTSVMNMIHWRQLVLSKRFQKYDYGTDGNILHYQRITPPEYDLANIDVPMSLFLGTADSLSDTNDVKALIYSLKGAKNIWFHEYPAAHMTFLWAKDKAFYFDDLLKAIRT